MSKYSVIDTDTHEISSGLTTLFPGWAGASENICVYGPHDDDAVIGAGYAIKAALDDGASVHIFIICSGNAGYSNIADRDTIVETRRGETLACYKALGVPESNIVFFNISDFSALSKIGWNVATNQEGHFKKTLTELRTRKITRVLVPNHYREHIDHVAASMMAAYDAPQCGDACAVDWADPSPVKSVAEYSVWADLDPEDALLHGRSEEIRANCVLVAPEEVEMQVCQSISHYASQAKIIDGLIRARKERRIADGRYIEVYLRFDPRPKLDFSPYRQLADKAMAAQNSISGQKGEK